MSRYVILRHEMPANHDRAPHFDLMLEQGESLATWSFEASLVANRPVTATALPTHRVKYLDYEGPVSGNRGAVRRWDSGAFEVIERKAELWLVRVHGKRLNGTLRICRSDPHGSDDQWSIAYSADGIGETAASPPPEPD